MSVATEISIRGAVPADFDLVRKAGRIRVRAITSPQNAQSIAYQTSTGFTVSDPIENYDGLGITRLVFERAL